MKIISYLCLSVWLVCVSTSLSSNVTDSSSTDILPTRNDEPNIEMADTGYSDINDDTGNLRLRHRLREDITERLGTRGILFGRRERSIMEPYMRPRRSFGMFGSPPFYRQTSMGYGGRYPRRYSRYGPYGRYESDPYMENYGMYPQGYGGYQTYNEQPMTQSPSYYHQPASRPYGQPQSPYYRPESYMQPQSTQSLYRGQPFQPQRPQQQQQFATANPYYLDQQAMESNVRPQSVPFSEYTYNSAPQQKNRVQPTDSQVKRSGFNPQFRTATQAAGQRDPIEPQIVPAPNYERPIDSQLQRSGLNPQFGTATQAAGQRNAVQPQIVATPNRQQSVTPEFQRAGSNIEQRREGMLNQNETSFTPPQNLDQTNVQQPFSSLVSYLSGPSATTTETNNDQPQSMITPSTQQSREMSKPTQVEQEVATAA